MRYQKMGTSELEVSEACLGTMTFGEQNTEAEGHQQLDMALEHGVNFIDTAEMYPVPASSRTQGDSESIIGSWLTKQSRDKVILASKVSGHCKMSWIRNGTRLDLLNIRTALEDSLRRLKTDYIDLYQIHWPDRYVPKFGSYHFDERQYYEHVPIMETMKVMDGLIKAGKIRHYGLSNETAWGVCQYMELGVRYNLINPVSIQNAYNLLNRVFDSQLAEVSYQERIPLLAYSPLAFGHLTGKYLGGALPAGSRMASFPNYGQRYLGRPNSEQAVKAYQELAGEQGLVALALRFVASRPFCTSTIIGATSLAQLSENLQAFEQPISAEALAGIEEIHDNYPNPCP